MIDRHDPDRIRALTVALRRHVYDILEGTDDVTWQCLLFAVVEYGQCYVPCTDSQLVDVLSNHAKLVSADADTRRPN